MSRKALSIFVDVDIQAVTCPGVWLCPNGKVQLVTSMLGQLVKTRRLRPVFPLLINEHFSFHKVFPSAGCLSELQSLLGMHDVEAVLLQEANGEPVVKLARFKCSVLHLLFPSPCSKGLLAGVDVDLLMEASADFPGILSPKIELSTRTTVEEITDYYLSPKDYSEAYLINPKTLVSQGKSSSSPDGYITDVNRENASANKCSPKKKRPSRPSTFVEDSRQRNSTNRSIGGKCHAADKRATSLPRRIGSSTREVEENCCDSCMMTCPCGTRHVYSRCSLCYRYKELFQDSVLPEPTHGKEVAKRIRRCRCPDRRSCAFLRCQRCPRSQTHNLHVGTDQHWESSPAAASLRRSHGYGFSPGSSRSQVVNGTGISFPTAAPPSVPESLPGNSRSQSPATAALHARVERLLQPATDPDNISKWIGSYQHPKTSPVQLASGRGAFVPSSDDSTLSRKSPLSPRNTPSCTKNVTKLRLKPAAIGRVLRTYPCSCSNSVESNKAERRKSCINVFNVNSGSVDSKIFEMTSDEIFDSDVPNEKSELGDRRVTFYANLERYYRKLYMRAKARAAHVNAY